MATTQISTGLYLDKRRETEQGTYPIKVSVSHQHNRKYYSIGLVYHRRTGCSYATAV